MNASNVSAAEWNKNQKMANLQMDNFLQARNVGTIVFQTTSDRQSTTAYAYCLLQTPTTKTVMATAF